MCGTRRRRASRLRTKRVALTAPRRPSVLASQRQMCIRDSDERGLAAQLDIFRNAARHLAPGGCLVVESWVMTDAQRNGSWSVVPRYVGAEHVELQLARFDLSRNAIERTLVHLRSSGLEFIAVTDTYASPGELDVMAEATGFRRIARYAGWDRSEFAVTSTNHVSIYSLRDE